MPAFNWLPILGGIIFIDLILSGDNAVMIGSVAAGLPERLRRAAFVFGGGCAILLRISLTYSASLLLSYLPPAELLGGLFVFVIAIRLLLSQKKSTPQDNPAKKNEHAQTKTTGFLSAMCTILIADAIMSLDNVVAVAAVAKSHPLLLITGLLLSIILLLTGSALVAYLIDRYPWLTAVAAVILVVTAAELILQYQPWASSVPALNFPIFSWNIPSYSVLIYFVLLSITAGIIGWRWWHNISGSRT